MAAQPQYEPRFTVAEYLELDRESVEKLEYADGEIVAMTGASRNHAVITSNLHRVLGNQLLETNCLVFSSDMRVKVDDSTVSYRYPDVTVVCGEERYTDENPPSLLNPTVIVEVLSESTQAADRGAKLKEYRAIPSVQAYVLVAQDKPQVEYYLRNPDGGKWWYDDETDLDASVALPNPACKLALAKVYRKVSLESGETDGASADTPE